MGIEKSNIPKIPRVELMVKPTSVSAATAALNCNNELIKIGFSPKLV